MRLFQYNCGEETYIVEAETHEAAKEHFKEMFYRSSMSNYEVVLITQDDISDMYSYNEEAIMRLQRENERLEQFIMRGE